MHYVQVKRLSRLLNTHVLVLTLVVTALDALTKWWARHHLSGHAVHVVGPWWWRLQYNEGISFSLNRSGPLATTVGTLVVAAIVLLVAVRAAPGLPTYGFGLLLGGGVGNVVDRLAAQPHRVTDFVAVGAFPVFNLADSAITVGFVLLLVAVVRGERLVAR